MFSYTLIFVIVACVLIFLEISIRLFLPINNFLGFINLAVYTELLKQFGFFIEFECCLSVLAYKALWKGGLCLLEDQNKL